MDNIRDEYLGAFFEQMEPMDFYRFIFPEGELQRQDESGNWKCNAIAVELLPKESKRLTRRHTISDDLGKIKQLVSGDNFVLMSPISYVGKSREAKNARYVYAIAIDLDGVNTEANMEDLFFQMDGRGPSGFLPNPTFVVSSGNGLHIYYVFERPIPCFKNIVDQMSKLKRNLTRKLWNGFVTSLEDNVQYQSLFQGFRMVGSITKNGGRVKAFRTGERVTVEYLNEFVCEENRVTSFAYKSSLTRKEAKVKYPEWYEKRIVKGQPRGKWVCKRDLYDWWKKRLVAEVVEGHRYYGVMCLAVYAKKCGISKAELERDAFELIKDLDKKTKREDNHFDREDVFAALEMYNDDYITFPIATISELSGLKIDRNKRNGQNQKDHLEEARAIRDIRQRRKGTKWTDCNGRPSAEKKVKEWKSENPQKNIKECCEEIGLSRSTVYKYWNR